jgi:hypothetical protein
MARTRSVTWTVFISLLLGIAAATAFWLYSPYGQEQLTGKKVGEPPSLTNWPLRPWSNFQMVADSKQVRGGPEERAPGNNITKPRSSFGGKTEAFCPSPFIMPVKALATSIQALPAVW